MAKLSSNKGDLPSRFFSRVAYKLHPKIGKLYDGHRQFFNQGVVELLCMLIAYGFAAFFSYLFIGWALAVVLTVTATPITYCLKYLLNKHWVWKP